jgi:hypothetical protein
MENEEITYGSVEIHQDRPENHLPKNSINTPIKPSLESLVEKLDHYRRENERLRNNNETYKLDLIEAREKLMNILKIINK